MTGVIVLVFIMRKLSVYFILAACAAAVLASCDKGNSDKDKNPYDDFAVDLGLSVKWASVNVGASNEKGLGNYYAWGETSEKPDGTYYDWDSYLVFKGIGTDDASRDAALSRLYDSDLKLKSEFDVAHVKWGGSWRMPTTEEFKELLEKCTWEMVPSDYDKWSENNPGGWKVTSKINGKSIYIPASGQRTNMSLEKDKGRQAYYWTSNRDEDSDLFATNFGRFMDLPSWNIQYVCMGCTVRPVCP